VHYSKTIRRLQRKQSYIARFIQDKSGTLHSNKENILGRWREYFENPLILVTFILLDTQENTSTAAELLTVKKSRHERLQVVKFQYKNVL